MTISPTETEQQSSDGLFDVLMAAKEKKANATRATPPEGSHLPTGNSTRFPSLPRNAWMIIGTGLLLCVTAWAVAYFVKQRTPSVANLPEGVNYGGNSGNGATAGANPPVTPIPVPTLHESAFPRPSINAFSGNAIHPGAVPGNPPPNPAAMMPSNLNQHVEADREREEREREAANEAAAAAAAQSQPQTPPAPQVGDPGFETPPPIAMPPSTNEVPQVPPPASFE